LDLAILNYNNDIVEHLAILRKSNIKKGDNLLGEILSGKKTIESRWYVHKSVPWGKVKPGETIYFKESGYPVSARGKISNVLFFENLGPDLIKEIIIKYGHKIAPSFAQEALFEWGRGLVKKRYCIIIFLTDVVPIKPFKINKKGFGMSSAWIVTPKIEELRLSAPARS